MALKRTTSVSGVASKVLCEYMALVCEYMARVCEYMALKRTTSVSGVASKQYVVHEYVLRAVGVLFPKDLVR
jgi:hypothetical protein